MRTLNVKPHQQLRPLSLDHSSVTGLSLPAFLDEPSKSRLNTGMASAVKKLSRTHVARLPEDVLVRILTTSALSVTDVLNFGTADRQGVLGVCSTITSTVA